MKEIEKLIQELKSDDLEIRYNACKQLASEQQLPKEAKEALQRATKDPDPLISIAAHQALEYHKSDISSISHKNRGKASNRINNTNKSQIVDESRKTNTNYIFWSGIIIASIAPILGIYFVLYVLNIPDIVEAIPVIWGSLCVGGFLVMFGVIGAIYCFVKILTFSRNLHSRIWITAILIPISVWVLAFLAFSIKPISASHMIFQLRFGKKDFQSVNIEEFADLSNQNFDSVDLSLSNLNKTNFSSSSLRGANLSGATITYGNLKGARLKGANFEDANLRGANLSTTELWGANLKGADLKGADLSEAYLREADLEDADLRGADLDPAALTSANLRRANLEGARVTPERLDKAESLEGAVMPDGTIHD